MQSILAFKRSRCTCHLFIVQPRTLRLIFNDDVVVPAGYIKMNWSGIWPTRGYGWISQATGEPTGYFCLCAISWQRFNADQQLILCAYAVCHSNAAQGNMPYPAAFFTTIMTIGVGDELALMVHMTKTSTRLGWKVTLSSTSSRVATPKVSSNMAQLSYGWQTDYWCVWRQQYWMQIVPITPGSHKHSRQHEASTGVKLDAGVIVDVSLPGIGTEL